MLILTPFKPPNLALDYRHPKRPGDNWYFEVKEAFEFEYKGFIFREDVGKRLDMASIPQLFWSIISFADLGEVGVCMHDRIGENNGIPDGYHFARKNGSAAPITKEFGDRLCWEVMAREHIVPWKLKLSYRVVRLVRPSYHKNRLAFLGV